MGGSVDATANASGGDGGARTVGDDARGQGARATSVTPTANRLLCLDVFRGFVIVSMLLVNNTSAVFHPQLAHAPWGVFPTFTDMIFPWFLLMVGCAMPWSRASRLRRAGLGGDTEFSEDVGRFAGGFWTATLRRTAILFLLGCAIYTSLNVSHNLRVFWTGAGTLKPWLNIGIPGVLQPIALAFLCGAVVYELGPWWRWTAIIAGLLAWFGFLKFVPIPPVDLVAAGKPFLWHEPMWAAAFEEFRNGARFLNKVFLPPLSFGLPQWLIGGGVQIAGLPSILPMTCLVLIGARVGEEFCAIIAEGGWQSPTVRTRLTRLTAAGAMLLTLGLAMHFVLPMSKDCWTSPYILFTAGLGVLLLILCFVLVDGVPWRVARWYAVPFVTFGMNAILAYFGSIVVRIWTIDFVPLSDTVTAKLAIIEWLRKALPWHVGADGTLGDVMFVGGYITLWWLVVAACYRRRWFWRV